MIDVRRLGGLRHKMPQTYIQFLIGAMALAGIPLLSGFWAKDAVLATHCRPGRLDHLYHRRYHCPADGHLQLPGSVPDL